MCWALNDHIAVKTGQRKLIVKQRDMDFWFCQYFILNRPHQPLTYMVTYWKECSTRRGFFSEENTSWVLWAGMLWSKVYSPDVCPLKIKNTQTHLENTQSYFCLFDTISDKRQSLLKPSTPTVKRNRLWSTSTTSNYSIMVQKKTKKNCSRKTG